MEGLEKTEPRPVCFALSFKSVLMCSRESGRTGVPDDQNPTCTSVHKVLFHCDVIHVWRGLPSMLQPTSKGGALLE